VSAGVQNHNVQISNPKQAPSAKPHPKRCDMLSTTGVQNHKLQITNPKQAPNTNTQNDPCVFEILFFGIDICL
jgi:hypothetical protein